MRITPITVAFNRQNLKSQNQNVNFGKFDSAETRQYVEQNILRPDKYEEPATEALDYFDKTPFVTIKRNKGITYAVAETSAINEHKNRSFFEDAILSYRRLGCHLDRKNLIATEKNIIKGRGDKAAINAGIVKAEPNYLTAIGNFSGAHVLYTKFINAENGYIPASTNLLGSSSERYEPDAWDKAHDWMKN